MKAALLTIVLSLLLAQQSFSQVHEEDLIGTWFPVMEQDMEGDTSSVLRYIRIYKFLDESTGYLEEPGLNVKSELFTYRIISDSIFLQVTMGEMKERGPWEIKGKVLDVDKNHLKIAFRPYQIITFISLPSYEIKESVKELKNKLYNEVWEFSMDFEGYGEPYKVLYQFDQKTDSSWISKDYQGSIHTLEVHNKFYHTTDPAFWATGIHDKSIIIRVNDSFSDFRSFTYLVKEVSKNTMKLIVWKKGIAYPVVARRKRPLSNDQSKRNLSRLTRPKWQFRSEKIPPPMDTTGFIILEAVLDDFEELAPYKRDSTAIISQNDLDEKLLILEFKPDGTYYIYRKDRVLDTGSWMPIFNMAHLRLRSSRKISLGDGIFGGTIEIKLLKKGKLILRRVFEQQSSISGTSDESYWETYRPYKKEK